MDKVTSRKSGKYTTFQQYAYLAGKEDVDVSIWRIPFPDTWSRKLYGFEQKYNLVSEKGQVRKLPFRSLNSLLTLTIPSLITPGFQYTEFPTPAWRMLLTAPPEKLLDPLTILVRIWAKYHFEYFIASNPNSQSILLELDEILGAFSCTDFQTEKYQINLSNPELDSRRNPGNEILESLYYKALPLWLVEEFCGSTFSLGGFPLRMYRTQKPNQRNFGLELMSWMPLQMGEGFMSFVLDFDLQTLPTKNSRPLVYPRWHVRRWIHRPLTSEKTNYTTLPYGKNVTVYVKGQIPWLNEALGIKDTFTTTSIRLKRNETGTQSGWEPQWESNLSAILERAGWPVLESANSFARRTINFDTEPILAGVFGSQTQKSMRTRYPIGDGLFLQDLQELMEQLNTGMVSKGFSLAKSETVSQIKLTNLRGLKERIDIRTKLFELEEVKQAKIRNALEETLPKDRDLTIEIYYLNQEFVHAMWNEIFKHFGFHTSFVNDQPDLNAGFVVKTPEQRTIKILAYPNQFKRLNNPGSSPASYRASVQEFVKQIRDNCPPSNSDDLVVAFIELQNLNRNSAISEKSQDAKDASRFGYAMAGRLTQFSEPVPTGGNQKEQSANDILRKSKARASVLDMRRQLGYIDSTLDDLLEGTNFQPGIQLIGLHLEQQNSTWNSRTRGYKQLSFPVAVRIRAGERRVDALTPDKTGDVNSINWMPYSKTALELGIRSGMSLFGGTDQERKERSIDFLTRLLNLIGDEPAILFVSANLWRKNGLWNWLQDRKIKFDHMDANNTTYLPDDANFTPGNTKKIKGLRVVRYRTDEVPAYLVFDPEKPQKEQAGHASGLVQISERIFYSIAPKPDAYRKPYRFSRVGEGYDRDARISTLVEVVPAFMQSQDNAFDLAKIFHMLRAVVPHWKEGLITDPLPNHLAERLVSNYLVMRTLTELENSNQDGNE